MLEASSGRPSGKISFEPCLGQAAISVQLPGNLPNQKELTEFVVAISADAKCSEGHEQIKAFDLEFLDHFKKNLQLKPLKKSANCGLNVETQSLGPHLAKTTFSLDRPQDKVSLTLVSLSSANPSSPPPSGPYQIISMESCYQDDNGDRLLVLNVKNSCSDCDPNVPESHWQDYRTFSGVYVQSRVDNLIGLSAYKKKQYKTAASWFSKAVEKDSDYVVARVNLAGSLARSGKDVQALEHLKVALKDDPEYTRKKMKTDRDFSGIKKDPRFKALLR